MALMNEVGTTVYIKVPAEVIVERLMAHGREQRPLVAGKSHEEIKQFVTETLANRLAFYQNAHITYQNASRDITDLCRLLLNMENIG
jgi:shikimate kinase